MKIGFFGGSFNPPSYVHINLAKELIYKQLVEKVIFVPVGDYYKKEELINSKHRINMLKLAIEEETNFAVDTIATESNIQLYASDVFKLIKVKYKNDDIFFIMGSDNYRKMPTWKNYKELISKYNIIVIERERKQIRKTNNKKIFQVIPENLQEIDSSKIRKMIKNNENAGKFLNKKVLTYIKENTLYQ